jgi:light-harvesting complex 1 beta chain
MAENNGGMTEEEAKAFHGYFVAGMMVFFMVAVAAHALAWMWRPWL